MCIRDSLIPPVDQAKCAFFPPPCHTYLHPFHRSPIHPSFHNFFWVSSHRGIQSNESVDSAAKAATNVPQNKPSFLSIKLDSIFFIRKHITNHWISLWQNQAPSNELAQAEPLPFSGLRLTKLIAVMKYLTYRPHSHYAWSPSLQLIPPFMRTLQSDSPLTIDHMFECPALTALRLMHHVPHSLKASLSNDSALIPNIFFYLQAANFFSRI